jgi:cytochrome oxidase assembly protein ShyY1
VGLGTWQLGKADGRTVDAIEQAETPDEAVAAALRLVRTTG